MHNYKLKDHTIQDSQSYEASEAQTELLSVTSNDQIRHKSSESLLFKLTSVVMYS